MQIKSPSPELDPPPITALPADLLRLAKAATDHSARSTGPPPAADAAAQPTTIQGSGQRQCTAVLPRSNAAPDAGHKPTSPPPPPDSTAGDTRPAAPTACCASEAAISAAPDSVTAAVLPAFSS
ncbi:hypothetical protein PtA15_8A215 [Puccinia triticina]|uniref:Uncharacterized protein n=1 Tax=Puccinia triticina TaxID=208348 RepID=A0ABY7CT58_9BASI|nr:uncharacterized protein PtA15_8A215 [Puccinia triticina]WAQ87311.1 hypothetical protein PtA15_8A215 [Puccinia triticina]WAR57165.1 hypothetical protein PtB15_8B212 [Puccinia triticina]